MRNKYKCAHSFTVSWPAHIASSGLERQETHYTVTSIDQQYSNHPTPTQKMSKKYILPKLQK